MGIERVPVNLQGATPAQAPRVAGVDATPRPVATGLPAEAPALVIVSPWGALVGPAGIAIPWPARHPG